MLETTETAEADRALSPRQRKRAIASWEAQRKRELDASLAVLRARRTAERWMHLCRVILSLWPVWVGIYIGLFGSVIEPFVKSIGPWCVTLVYPFVVLASRPEFQFGTITAMLPTVMLYAQFPLEGLVAYIVLRRRSRPLSVIWQVFLLHFLGVMELWMLGGGAAMLVGR